MKNILLQTNKYADISLFLFHIRLFWKNDEQSDHQEHRNSIDDDLPVYFSTLLRVQDQALLRHDPIKQIKLETGLRVFYDQVNNSTENSFAFH